MLILNQIKFLSGAAKLRSHSAATLDIFEWKLGLDEREIFSIFSLMWSTVTTSDA